jgi:hypothetical protein
VMVAALLSLRASSSRGIISVVGLSATTRFALALALSWLCSLPHAYVAVPHYKENWPLYVSGIEAYATGNALAAFIVCVVILILARRTSDGGIKIAFVAAVFVNAALLFQYYHMTRPPS